MRLELGSSTHPTEGYVHLDIAAACQPDVIADVTRLPFADGAVTDLRGVDVLEHVSYRRVFDVAAEWGRVLARRGKFYVQVPDVLTVMHGWITGEWPPSTTHKADPDFVTYEVARARDHGGVTEHPDLALSWVLLGGQDDGTFIADPEDWRFNAHNTLFTEDLLRSVLDAAGLVVDKLESNPHPNLCCWGHKP